MKDFIDERGEIRNAKNVAWIFSQAGAVRSNHYHKTGGHLLYVIGGRMTYRERPVGGGPEKVQDVYPGGAVYTGPGVEHRTEFPEDTLMLSFGSLPAGGEYEADTVAVKW